MRLTSHIPPGQFVRYLMVGTWNTVFGYSVYAALVYVLTPRLRFAYIYALVISSFINITVAFLGYKYIVFRTKGNFLKEWLRCIVVYTSGMPIGLVVLPIVVETLRHVFHMTRSAPYVGAALMTGVGVIYSFLGHKNFSFRSSNPA